MARRRNRQSSRQAPPPADQRSEASTDLLGVTKENSERPERKTWRGNTPSYWLNLDFRSFVLGLVLPVFVWIRSTYLAMVFGLGRWIGGGEAGQAVELDSKVRRHRSGKRQKRHKAVKGDVEQRSALEQYGYYPGMVNLSGVLCYMNSVLQVGPAPKSHQMSMT